MTDKKSLREVKIGQRLTNVPTPKKALSRKEFDEFIEQDKTLRKAEARLILHIYAGTLTYNTSDKKKESWLSQKTVAARAGLNKDTVSAYVRVLKDAGYLIPGNEYKATAYHTSQGYFLGRGNAEGYDTNMLDDKGRKLPALQSVERSSNSASNMKKLNKIRESKRVSKSDPAGPADSEASPMTSEETNSDHIGMAVESKSDHIGEDLSDHVGEDLSDHIGTNNKAKYQEVNNNSTPPADSSLPADAVRSESDASLDSACGADKDGPPLIKTDDVEPSLITKNIDGPAYGYNIKEHGNSDHIGLAREESPIRMHDEDSYYCAACHKSFTWLDTDCQHYIGNATLHDVAPPMEEIQEDSDDDWL